MTENEIASIVVDASLKVHRGLGPGLLESAYEVVLAKELRKRGLKVERQVIVAITWDGEAIDEGFRADLVVEGKFIIELKSVEKLAKVHFRQLLTYLRLTDCRLGLLINFNEVLIKDGIHRVVNGLMD
jgi:GxxExxY protein